MDVFRLFCLQNRLFTLRLLSHLKLGDRKAAGSLYRTILSPTLEQNPMLLRFPPNTTSSRRQRQQATFFFVLTRIMPPVYIVYLLTLQRLGGFLSSPVVLSLLTKA